MKEFFCVASLVIILVSFGLSFGESLAFADAPATWDPAYFNADNLVENTDWEIMAETDNTITIGANTYTYCVGIFRYSTIAYDDQTDDMEEGSAYGYYAVERPVDGIHQADCTALDEWIHEYNYTPRPAVLFLHGNQGRGSFGMAAWMAYNFADPEAAQQYKPMVFAISAPGQGLPCIFSSKPECVAYNGSQVSVGQGMTPPTSWVEGFNGYSGDDDEPEHQILWGYTLSAMRAVNVIKRVFGTGDLGFVNNKLVVGGFSAGGIASLLLNTHDDRPDGVFTLSASGGWDNGLKQYGSAMAWLLTAETYLFSPYDPTYYIDCPTLRWNPTAFPVDEQKACQVVDYFDPIKYTAAGYEPKNPTLLTAGAQDEVFPITAFQATYNFLDQFDEDVYRYQVADFDHKYYWWVNKILRDYEAYGSFDPSYNLSEYYQMNALLKTLRSYVQRIARGLTPLLPAGPAATSMASWVKGNVKTYRVVSCWNNTASWEPNDVYFNISIDKGYHVLPACNNGSFYPTIGQYILRNSAYAYNSACTVSDDDDEDWTYNEKCLSAQTSVSTNDIFYGIAYTTNIPAWLTCRKLDVTFSGVTFPEHFQYWAELRYSNETTGTAVVSGPVQETGTAESQCLRPYKSNDNVSFIGLMAAMGMDDDDDDSKGDGDKDLLECADLVIDETTTFTDGDILNYRYANLIIAANGSLEGEGTVQLNSSCDVIIREGGRIAATNGSIGITARNVSIEGLLETRGERGTGGISIVAAGDIAISGEVAAESLGWSVAAGQVHLGASGSIDLTGIVTATGLGSGGAAAFYAGGDVTIDGALLAETPFDGSYGGRVEISSPSTVELADAAQVSTLGDLDDGQVLIFYGCDLLVDENAAIETGDWQPVNADLNAPLPEATRTTASDDPYLKRQDS